MLHAAVASSAGGYYYSSMMYQAISFDYASNDSTTEMHQHQTRKFSSYVTENNVRLH